MKPIINPWWIYFAEKSEVIGDGCIIFGILATIVCIMFWIGVFDDYDFKKSKWLIAIAIVGILFGSLLPSQKTVLTMMTVQHLTPNNIESVGNTMEDTIDYIVDRIEEIIEKE